MNININETVNKNNKKIYIHVFLNLWKQKINKNKKFILVNMNISKEINNNNNKKM